MKHFLVTRFNLTVTEWKTTKNGEPVLTEKWLKNRFMLFENYCLPSVKNQTNQNFMWCVFFDINTPDSFRNKIKIISDDYQNFKPIFIDGIKMLNSAFIQYAVNHSKDDDEFVITTRLDNDDLIHKNFIETIQKLYKPIDKMVIDLVKGYSITLGKPYCEIREYTTYFNPFISVVESVTKIETVISKMHLDWKGSKDIVEFTNSKLWIELIHQENKLNSTKKDLKRVYKIKNSDFGLVNEFEIKELPIVVFMANAKLDIKNIFKFFKRKFKSLLKRLLK